MMWAVDKCLVMLVRKRRSRYYALACFGRKRHYRKDGSCAHTEAILARVKPRARKLVKVNPWGGQSASNSRADP